MKPASADASAPAPPPRFRDCLAAMTGKVLLEYRVRARARANKRVLMRVPGAAALRPQSIYNSRDLVPERRPRQSESPAGLRRLGLGAEPPGGQCQSPLTAGQPPSHLPSFILEPPGLQHKTAAKNPARHLLCDNGLKLDCDHLCRLSQQGGGVHRWPKLQLSIGVTQHPLAQNFALRRARARLIS